MGSPTVGFFDSGIGGLSVARAFLRLRPSVRTLYVADWEHCPYGDRPDAEILDRSRQLLAHLRGLGCGLVVIACNSASAVALRTLREENPGFPIVGMEPAVKPAAALSRTGAVGILATAHTLRGRLFLETAARCDPIVLGCTHYPFLLPLLRAAAPGVTFLDPSEAVARRAAELCDRLPPEPPAPSSEK